MVRPNSLHGPVGAFQGASLVGPMAPRGTGGVFARPLVDPLWDKLPVLPEGARIVGQGVHGPIVAGLENRFPEAVGWYATPELVTRPVFYRTPSLENVA